MMELLSPAGTSEKLSYAYAYGADAAYIGMQDFSLRTHAGNITDEEVASLARIKGDRKLFGAINSYFHEDDLRKLINRFPQIEAYPFDAFIVSDLGAADLLQQRFPQTKLHLSTQANCLNSSAAKAYWKMGFSRIILGRETPLSDIRRIKDAVPDIEIETFVHGAMCMAYSGRCFLSSFFTGRSANQGDCSQSCRWSYRLMQRTATGIPVPAGELALEEEERPGVYYPVYEGDGYTTILSSKDLCMIDHLKDLKEAGVDSLKIEGRMKSLYYVATVTRAYRKAIDALEGLPGAEDWRSYRDELFHVSHREFSTGFFYGPEAIESPTEQSYLRDYLFIGTIEKEIEPGLFSIALKNQISIQRPIEYIGPDQLCINDAGFTLFDVDMHPIVKQDHGKTAFLQTSRAIHPGYIIRCAINA
ncbi:MAG: peptidase U32 family protein [Sphaerochaetaceae bacterium]